MLRRIYVWHVNFLVLIIHMGKSSMQTSKVFIGSIIFIPLFILAGCYGPTPYRISGENNTFGIHAENPNQKVTTVAVYDSSQSPLGTLVWKIDAVEPVLVKDFVVTVGQVPPGFRQDVPEGNMSFIPINGRLYSIGIVREHDESCVVLPWVADTSLLKENLVYEQKSDIYIHKTSGFKFPAKIGSFTRGKDIIGYDVVGNDFSVPYYLSQPESGIIGTVYVYPALIASDGTSSVSISADEILEKAYEKAKQEVLIVHSGKIVSESSYIVTKSSNTYIGKRAVFQLPVLNIESYLYIFVYHDWLVKYRFTSSTNCVKEAGSEVEKFVQEYEWQ